VKRTDFPQATHVLSYEQDDVMVEVLVRKDGEALQTAAEWAGHAVSEWTLEEDGRLCYCGVDFAAERGVCSLRPIGAKPLNLDLLLRTILRGVHDMGQLASIFSRSFEEIETSVATLERLGKVTIDRPGNASPLFDDHPVLEDSDYD
jgi:hypothetical protein